MKDQKVLNETKEETKELSLPIRIHDDGSSEEYDLVITSPDDIESEAIGFSKEMLGNWYSDEKPGCVSAGFEIEFDCPENMEELTELAEFLGDTPLKEFLDQFPLYGDCSIDILPDVPDCPEAEEHDWTNEFENGCTENPGVWDTGNGRMKYIAHCRHCGMMRTNISLYASGNSNRSGGVPDETEEYSDPNPDWVAKYIEEEE